MGFVTQQMPDFFIFYSMSRPGVGPPSLQFNGKWRSFPATKRSGHDAEHSPSSRAEVKERAELHLSSPLYAFIECTRTVLPLPFMAHIPVSPTTERSTQNFSKLKIRYHIFASSDARMQSAQAEQTNINEKHTVGDPSFFPLPLVYLSRTVSFLRRAHLNSVL